MAQYSIEERLLLLRFLVAASARYARSCVKNCVKILLRRNTYFHDDDLFFRQYALHLIGLRPIRKITCTRRLGSEGAGSQALMVMNAINFARSSGLTYMHMPFVLIDHAERPQQEWASAWEALLNLGAGEIACDVNRHEVVNYCYCFTGLELCFGWHARANELANRFKNMIPEFRRKYYLDKSPRTTEEVTVAVHIRRGDDVSANYNNYLFTSTDTILRTITAVRSILDAHRVKYRIGVYSDGNGDDVAEVSLPGVELFLNVDAIWTMQELIEADVLIMAKSSFSYYAALISDGIKIFEPLRFPMDDWILRSPDGSFDRAAFECQLSALLQAKRSTATSIGKP